MIKNLPAITPKSRFFPVAHDLHHTTQDKLHLPSRKADDVKDVFYSEQLGDYVVDELCKCGHLKSEHGSKLTKINEKATLREPHNGSCCTGGCACAQFAFARYVTVEEAAGVVVAKRGLMPA